MIRQKDMQRLDDNGDPLTSDHWTLAKICEKAAARPPDGGPILGVNTQPPIDCIEVDRYIVPILHLQLGLVNDVLKNLLAYIDERRGLETLPVTEIEAREEYVQACLDKADCKEASVIWDRMYGPVLAEKRLYRSQLIEWLKLPRSILFGEERAQMEDDEYTLEISNVLSEKQKVESEVNAAEKAVVTAQKKLAEAACSVETTDKVLRAQIETILKNYGIDQAAWHGGDLVGSHCR
jgi:hypothetical protein